MEIAPGEHVVALPLGGHPGGVADRALRAADPAHAGGRRRLAAGDVVAFPVGPDGAHQVSNATDTPCRVIMLSNREPVNVVVYPDSGKISPGTPWGGGVFPESAAVDYWEGE